MSNAFRNPRIYHVCGDNDIIENTLRNLRKKIGEIDIALREMSEIMYYHLEYMQVSHVVIARACGVRFFRINKF